MHHISNGYCRQYLSFSIQTLPPCLFKVNLGRRKRSCIWIHFDDVENTAARCKSCKAKIAHRSGSTTNLHRHMRRVHPAVQLEQATSHPTEDVDDHSSDIVSAIATPSTIARNSSEPASAKTSISGEWKNMS